MDKRKLIAVSEDTHTKIKIAAAQRKLSVKDYIDTLLTEVPAKIQSLNESFASAEKSRKAAEKAEKAIEKVLEEHIAANRKLDRGYDILTDYVSFRKENPCLKCLVRDLK